MKYTIEGFSQSKAIELKLDLPDLIILRWVVDFSNTDKMVKMQVDNKIYFWLKYEGLLKELPILGITKDGLYRRLMRLVDKGVLEHTTVKQGGTYSMYRLGKSYESLISDSTVGTESIPIGYGNNSVGGTESIPEQNNNLLSNKSIKENQSLPNGKEGKALKKSYNTIFSDPENVIIKDALVKFIESCKGKGYNPKVTTVEKFAKDLRDLSKNNSSLAMLIVQQSIDKGWKALYPLKDKYKADAISKKFTGEVAKDENGKEIVY